MFYRPEPLLKGVYNMKFAKPSKIQSVALPLILAEYALVVFVADEGEREDFGGPSVPFADLFE